MWGMRACKRLSCLAWLAAAAGLGAREPPEPSTVPVLAYEPVALGWSAEEVARAASAGLQAVVQRAEQSGRLGCRRHCERIAQVFARLHALAEQQAPQRHEWALTVVDLDDQEAMALPDGRLLVSEHFVDRYAMSDEALAFVLAHEMAHSILEHERQALSFARMLLPAQVERSVQDVYVELDYNFALLKALEPVLQQGELEADELGLLLASAAGFTPEQQLVFLQGVAAEEGARTKAAPALLRTHPPAAERLQALRDRLPLARRLMPR